MGNVRARSEEIRLFILQHVQKHPSDISKLTEEEFGITRQAANKHLQRLVLEGALEDSGATRNHEYKLLPSNEWNHVYDIVPGMSEGDVWIRDIKAVLGDISENALDIWQYGFTEMFNNAIDHSEAKNITVSITQTATDTKMIILDTGVGIFRKIQKALNLMDERHAILELAKGKLTTDPKRHTGEGIFFTSRMFDEFDIRSGNCFFTHKAGERDDWLLETDAGDGTAVLMELNNNTPNTSKHVFDQYSSGEDYGFTKTIVPVKLAKYGDDKLISRSQAKRLLARVELFKTVVFDFKGVDTIGHSFADEIFRVFASQHPEIELINIRTSEAVEKMIHRAKVGGSVNGTSGQLNSLASTSSSEDVDAKPPST
jgi:anti-sigma regulatory factor (Ser/Thr protein kinase)